MTRTIAITIICALFTFVQSASAAGFRLLETDNVGQGQAHAMVAGVTDSAAVYYNPAAMAELEKYGAKAGFEIIDPKTKVTQSSANSETANESYAVPHIYSVKKLQDSGIAIGFGVFSNFGAGTQYSIYSPLRYEATVTQLRTTTANVSGAMSLDLVSIGLGLNYMTSKVIYNSMYPFTGAGADGYALMEGSGSSFGINAGLLFKATDAIKIGLAYRSPMSAKLKGTMHIENFPSPLLPILTGHGITGDDYSSDAETTVNFPGIATAGVNINITEAFSMEVDADMTQWSSFDKLEFTFASPLSHDGTTLLPSTSKKDQKWKDTVSIRAGVAFKYDSQLTLRAGYYIDPSPVPDDTFTPRIPDADRNVITVGFSYAAEDKYVVDASFAYVNMGTRTVSNSVGAPATDVSGDYNTTANVFGVSFGYKF